MILSLVTAASSVLAFIGFIVCLNALLKLGHGTAEQKMGGSVLVILGFLMFLFFTVLTVSLAAIGAH